jgi:hypothetical protein
LERTAAIAPRPGIGSRFRQLGLSRRRIALLGCMGGVAAVLVLAIGRSSLPSLIGHGWESLNPGSASHRQSHVVRHDRIGTARPTDDAAQIRASTTVTGPDTRIAPRRHSHAGTTSQALPRAVPTGTPAPTAPGAKPAPPSGSNPPGGGGTGSGGGGTGSGGSGSGTGGGGGSASGSSSSPSSPPVSVSVDGNSADASVDTGTGTSVGATVPVPSDPTQPSTPTVTTTTSSTTPEVPTPVATVPSTTLPGL